MRAVIVALLLGGAVLTAPAIATDQGSGPLGPLQDFSPEPEPEPPPVVDDTGDGLQSWQELLIFGGGAILLAGIAYAIVSDARRRAPVSSGQAAHPALGHAPKRNRSQKQRERARAAARDARRQRKRQRRR